MFKHHKIQFVIANEYIQAPVTAAVRNFNLNGGNTYKLSVNLLLVLTVWSQLYHVEYLLFWQSQELKPALCVLVIKSICILSNRQNTIWICTLIFSLSFFHQSLNFCAYFATLLCTWTLKNGRCSGFNIFQHFTIDFWSLYNVHIVNLVDFVQVINFFFLFQFIGIIFLF